jgi:Mg-chelatase subunit ChlD
MRTPMRSAVALGLLLLAATAPSRAEDAPGLPPPATLSPRVAPEVERVRGFLRHSSWAVRSVAAWNLRHRTEPGVALALSHLLEREEHEVVVDCALAAVASLARRALVRDGGRDLVERVFRHAEHPNARVRARAWAALARLAPVPLARSLEDYRGWWRRGAETHAREQQELLRRPAEGTGAVPSAPGEMKSIEPMSTTHEYVEHVVRDGLEICILLDDTGSMAPVIAQAKAQAVTVLRQLTELVERVRAGLVTYKDGASLSVSLTSDEEALRKAVRRLGASGGGDIEEGVDKAIRLALRQESMGWSRAAARVLVVIGDAPPHEEDVDRMVRDIRKARADELYDHPVVLHTVSTDVGGVPHFARIAAEGGGTAVTLHGTGRLVEELVALAFGEVAHRIRPWIDEVRHVRRADPIR